MCLADTHILLLRFFRHTVSYDILMPFVQEASDHLLCRRKEVLKNVRSEQLLTLAIYSQTYSVSQRKLVGILEQKVATRYR